MRFMLTAKEIFNLVKILMDNIPPEKIEITDVCMSQLDSKTLLAEIYLGGVTNASYRFDLKKRH